MVKIEAERLPNLNVPRSSHALLYVNGEVVVIGGHTDGFVPTPTAEYFADGKWHLMFYDLDSCFYATDNCFSNLFAPWNLQSRQVCQLAGALLQNPDFRASLLSRAGELIPTALSNERILEEIDRLSGIIDPEVARDYQFYEMFKENWEWNVDWLRNLIRESNWEQACIDQLCSYLQVTAEERALYFPGR